LRRIVIAIDPPTGDGTCGIIACAKDEHGRAHILADHSVTARTPEGWARAATDAAAVWSIPPRDGEGDRPKDGGGGSAQHSVSIVAESNQGGEMVKSVLRTADPELRVKLVHARHGKAERASPVAILFEAGKVVLHGRFPELEAQLCGMIAGGAYEGPGDSPDRADAMVWGLTELMLTPEPPEPRVRRL
jgi:phage terminase large subunit-like protein